MDTHSFSLSSSAFNSGEIIPTRFTCDGANAIPPLSWENAPAETKSFALIMDDPDVPAAVRADRHFTHWVLWNIPADTTELAERTSVGETGMNDAGTSGYTGPCPPPQFEPREHRYFFTLYALNSFLPLTAHTTQKELEKAMEGHVLAQAQLMGRYRRSIDSSHGQ